MERIVLKNNIEKEIKEYFSSLTEEDRSRQKGIYRFYCMMQYTDTERSLESILTDIRALPTITIVNTVGKTKVVSQGTYIAALSIKFVPSPVGVPASPEKKKLQILQNLKRISGVKRLFKISSSLERFDT